MKHFESFLDPPLREYIAYRHNLGYAKSPTVSHLLTFDRYVKEQKITPELLQPSFFLELRKDLKLEPRSINRVLSTLRVFFQFMVRRGYYIQNPLKDVPPWLKTLLCLLCFHRSKSNNCPMRFAKDCARARTVF